MSQREWRRAPRLLPPGLEDLLEGALARIALLDRQNGAAAIVVDDRNIEPGPLLEQLQIALHVGIDRRQSHQEKSRRDLDGKAGKRRTARRLGLLHQNTRDIRDTAEREISRQVERQLDGVARRQRLIGIAP